MVRWRKEEMRRDRSGAQRGINCKSRHGKTKTRNMQGRGKAERHESSPSTNKKKYAHSPIVHCNGLFLCAAPSFRLPCEGSYVSHKCSVCLPIFSKKTHDRYELMAINAESATGVVTIRIGRAIDRTPSFKHRRG